MGGAMKIDAQLGRTQLFDAQPEAYVRCLQRMEPYETRSKRSSLFSLVMFILVLLLCGVASAAQFPPLR